MSFSSANTQKVTSRPSFRKRLLFSLGPILAIVLTLLSVVVLIFAYSWLTFSAQSILEVEISDIEDQIVDLEGNVFPEAYNWFEPHHRYDAQHIDPYFLQVFDEDGYLLRASENIRLFTSDRYPSRILPYQKPDAPLFKRLRTFSVGDRRMYYRTRPIHDQKGVHVGYIQVARYDPGISLIMKRTISIVGISLVLVLSGLLGIIWWSARRVLRPLEQITKEARALSPTQLEQRINVPTVSDQETALLASTLNDVLERLEKSFVEVKRFTADAAHELQTPLTILKGHIDVALRRERSPEQYKETLLLLHEQTEGLVCLVRNLLQIARLNSSDNKLTLQKVDLVSLIQEQEQRLEEQTRKKKLTYKSNLPTKAWVLGNSVFLQEIIRNIVENAIKYTETGSITLSVSTTNERVILECKDTGIGMNDEVRQHATDRFFRAPTANVQDIAGSGLGLALVKQLVEQLRGQFHIDSTPGVGTNVRISFNQKDDNQSI